MNLPSFDEQDAEVLKRKAELLNELKQRQAAMKKAARRIIETEDFKALNVDYDKIEKILIDDCLEHNESDPTKYAFYINGKMIELRTFRHFIRGIERSASLHEEKNDGE